MFAKLMIGAAALVLCAQVGWAQTSHATPAPKTDDEAGTAAPAALAPPLTGTWKAKTEKLPLTGDFNEKVWGRGAQSVRDVTLTVRKDNGATLTITRKVVNKTGKVVPGSARTEEADLKLGAAKPGFATRVDHEVQVVKAERRYSDNPADKWTLQGLRVGVVTFTDGDSTVEVRFDPADGQGAFSELLTRETVKKARR
jgi:hypothetical protein